MIRGTEEILHSRRGTEGFDKYNMPVGTGTLFTNTIEAVVQPASGSIENSTTRTVVSTDYTLHIYGEVEVEDGDTFLIRGKEYELSVPARYYSPPKGFKIPAHTVVEVKRADG